MLPLVSRGFPTHPLDDDIQVTKEAIALMGTGLEETNIFAWPTKTTDFGIKDWRAVHSLAKFNKEGTLSSKKSFLVICRRGVFDSIYPTTEIEERSLGSC